eukprot:5149202-Amphidinium_carterae.1
MGTHPTERRQFRWNPEKAFDASTILWKTRNRLFANSIHWSRWRTRDVSKLITVSKKFQHAADFL